MDDIEFLRSLIFTYDLKRLFADIKKNVRINSKNELVRRKFPQERDSSRKKGL